MKYSCTPLGRDRNAFVDPLWGSTNEFLCQVHFTSSFLVQRMPSELLSATVCSTLNAVYVQPWDSERKGTMLNTEGL